jgi:SLT domain-containing protein
MASELESLLVRIEADTTALRRALAQADAGIAAHGERVTKQLGKSKSAFASYGTAVAGSMRGATAALLGMAAAVGGIAAVKARIVDTVELERAAKLAGLTTAELQRLNAAARATGLGGDSMADAMKELATKLGEVKTRTGGFYEFLRTQLPTAERQIRTAKTTAAAMEVVAEITRRLATAEERATFVKQALGEQGLQLIPILQKGAAGLREAAAEAEAYGQIVSEQAIQNTSAFSREVAGLSETIKSKFVNAFGAVAPYLTDYTRKVRELLTGKVNPDEIVGAFAGGVLRDKFAAAGAAVGIEFVGGISSGTKGLTASGEAGFAKFMDGFAASARKLSESGATIPGLDKLKLQVPIPDFTTETSTEAADALRELRIKLAEHAGQTTDAILLEYERDLEGFRRMLAEKQIDDADFQKAREQLSILAGQKIKAAYEEETKALRELTNEMAGSLESALGSGFRQMLEQGKVDFKQWTISLLADLATLIMRTLVLKQIAESIAGAFGSFMGGMGFSIPARASGGPVERGKPYMVGERGPEMFVPAQSGRIVSAAATERALAADAGQLSAALSDALEVPRPANDPTPAAPPTEPLVLDTTALAGQLSAALSDALADTKRARANGGPVATGRSYMVGERGPEMFVPATSGRIMSAADTARAGAASAPAGPSITYAIDARGADAGVEQRIYRAIAELERQRPGATTQLQATRRRFPTR